MAKSDIMLSVEAGSQPRPEPMNLLAWNCRGLGNCRAVQELVDIVQAQGPEIVFLSETWSDKEIGRASCRERV